MAFPQIDRNNVLHAQTDIKMFRSQLFLLLFIIKIIFSLEFIQRELEEDEELRYMVGLSEPLQSTLQWDYDENDETKLIFHWNITLINGYSGILAFSNYDLKTNNLDVIIFGEDKKLYNGYTDENSLLFIPNDAVELSYTIINFADIENGKKTKYTIEIIRPLDTCDKQQRNYIIDRGTIHLLTGSMRHEDFQKIKQGKLIEIDIKRMDLTLQRVQLLKSQVSLELILIFLFQILYKSRLIFHQ